MRDVMVKNFTGPSAIAQRELLNESRTQNFFILGFLMLATMVMLMVLFQRGASPAFSGVERPSHPSPQPGGAHQAPPAVDQPPRSAQQHHRLPHGSGAFQGGQ